jgi:putative DNA primase/helicase
MSVGTVVVNLPVEPLPAEEKQRRLIVEVNRLADLSTVDWTFQLQSRAEEFTERYGVSPAEMKALILARLEDKKKAKAEERSIEQRTAKKQRADTKQQKLDDKEKQKAEAEKEEAEEKAEAERREAKRKAAEKAVTFAQIQRSPSAEHEAKLVKLAKRLGADIDDLREEFADYVEEQIAANRDEPWAEPVTTAAMSAEVKAQWRRYVVASDDGTVATVLWTLMSWVHNEIATHSPILVFRSVKEGSGKSVSLGVLKWMTPHSYSGIAFTGSNIFHVIDTYKPTLIVDEAARAFHHHPELACIINGGWTRGETVTRYFHGELRKFEIFCPKIIGSRGIIDVSAETASRFIVVKMFVKLPEEKVEDFNYLDNENFVTLRRKLLRWSIDTAARLKDAKPEMPVGFDNRLAQNWKLLFAIADDAGGDWPQRAHAAAIAMSRKSEGDEVEPVRFLAAVRPLVTGLDFIASADLQKQLVADPLGEWRDFRGRGPISQKQMAELFDVFDIYPQVYHPTRRKDLSVRGYVIDEHFTEAFRRNLPPLVKAPPKRTPVHSKSKRGGKKRRQK